MSAPTINVPTTTIVGGKRTTLELLSAEVDRIAASLYETTIDALIAAAVSGKWSIFTTIASGQAATPAGSVFAVFDTDADALAFYRRDVSSSSFLGAIEGADALAAAVQDAITAKNAAETARDEVNTQVATLGAGLVNPQNALPALLTTGTGLNYAITPPNAPSAYETGMAFRLEIHTDSITQEDDGAFLNVSGLGARSLYRYQGSGFQWEKLSAGDLRQGDIVDVVYVGFAFRIVAKSWATLTEAKAGTGSGMMTAKLTKDAISEQVPQVLNASGAAPVFGCRAWVNFNGTTGGVRASGNVASVTKNGTGDYTVNFTTAMPDANYAVSITATDDGLTPGISPGYTYGQLKAGTDGLTRAAGSVRFKIGYPANTLLYDQSDIHVLIFR